MGHGDRSSVLGRQGPSQAGGPGCFLECPGLPSWGVSWGRGFVVDPPQGGPAFPPEVDATTPLCWRQTFKNLQGNGFAVKWNEVRGPFGSREINPGLPAQTELQFATVLGIPGPAE